MPPTRQSHSRTTLSGCPVATTEVPNSGAHALVITLDPFCKPQQHRHKQDNRLPSVHNNTYERLNLPAASVNIIQPKAMVIATSSNAVTTQPGESCHALRLRDDVNVPR